VTANIINRKSDNNWRDVFPDLDTSTDVFVSQLLDNANLVTLKENTTVFQQGDTCGSYYILLDGTIKVFTRAENGREIVLYRIHRGDSCVLTTSCLFGNKNYPAEGQTEVAVTALAIPADQFNQALQESTAFRELVFSAFSSHISELIVLVEEVAFGKLDIRLAKHLLNQCDDKQTLTATHQLIATELGSSREVISRQLKELEVKGYIKINRGNIKIKNLTALRLIAKN
jgi:CRP/FNR family transcriptional regulator